MLDKLTPQQEEMIPDHVKRWVAIGLSTVTEPVAVQRQIVRDIYDHILRRPCPYVIICVDSPLAAWLAVCMLSLSQVAPQDYSQVWSQVYSQVRSQIQSQVAPQAWSQIESQVAPQVASQIGSQVASQIESQVDSQVALQVRSQVRSQVASQVDSQVLSDVWTHVWSHVLVQVRSQVRSKIESRVRSRFRSFVWPYLDGHWSAYHFAWCDFWQTIVPIIKASPSLNAYQAAARIGLLYPFQKYAVVSAKPATIHRQPDGRLHADGHPAVAYADGLSVWALHGVRVPQWLAEDPAGQIRAQRIMELDNAEVRREFVRKVGLDRIYHELGGKVLHRRNVRLRTPDKKSWNCRYELLQLHFGESVVRHALKMPNPSLPGVWHVEYVPTECTTVEQAMNFRLNRREEDVNDKTGRDWYLHGDVIIKPKGAKTQKRWPALIA
jgi:hypothetical protein